MTMAPLRDERVWSPDSVLLGFEATVLPLAREDDGELVATLVRGMCDEPSRRAVLYVHGFVDYFFQSHVADAFNEAGWDFYALELRRHGRSLRGGNRPNYCTSLAQYDEELTQAIDIVRNEEEHDHLVVLAHSTGGLICSLYAHQGARRADIDALVLNSPFFAFAVPRFRRPLLPLAGAVGRLLPWAADPSGITPQYGESLRADRHGEWSYDLRWKPLRGFPIYFGWIRAVREAQARVARGLAIECPVLVMHAAASMQPASTWDDDYLRRDIVLDINDMERVGPRLGHDVTMHRVVDGIHDLFLASPAVRHHAIGTALSFIDARVAVAPLPDSVS